VEYLQQQLLRYLSASIEANRFRHLSPPQDDEPR
jgi:hypothetical protein